MSSNKINILVVEDESIVALDLATSLEKDGYAIVGIADNAVEAKELFTRNETDILLIDINIIGDKDGVETAAELLKIKKIPVIYLSAATEARVIERVKATQPAAFLTKPYSISNVRIAIELAISNFAAVGSKNINAPVQKADKPAESNSADKETILLMGDSVFIKQNYRFIKVPMTDILYAEAENNYIHLVSEQRKYTLRMSLQQLQDRMQDQRFIRIHRSYLVNMAAIHSFSETEVDVDNIKLPIGRNYKDVFLKQFDMQ